MAIYSRCKHSKVHEIIRLTGLKTGLKREYLVLTNLLIRWMQHLSDVYHHGQPFFIGHKPFLTFFSYFRAFSNIFLNIFTPLFRTYLGIPRGGAFRWCFFVLSRHTMYQLTTLHSVLDHSPNTVRLRE